MYLFKTMNFNISVFKKNLSVIILAGGKGERLKPLTKSLPKPLIKLEGRTIIEHIIFFFSKNKINKIIIAGGYKFKAFLNFRKKFNKNIKVINTGENQKIMKRIIRCLSFCNEYILICYGDTIADIKINSVIKKFLKSNYKTVICSYEMKSNFGVIKSNRSNIVYSFKEKPSLDIWFNIGYILVKKDILIKNKNKTFEKFLYLLSNSKNMINHKHRGKHITVNTLTELEKAKKQIKKI